MDLCTNNQGLWHKKSLVWVRFGHGFLCAQNHPSLCQICAGFWCLFFFLCDDFEARHYGLFFHGFRVLKADSISNVFSPGFFGTKVVFGPWFLCAHFSMDLTSKIIYPLLVGG